MIDLDVNVSVQHSYAVNLAATEGSQFTMVLWDENGNLVYRQPFSPNSTPEKHKLYRTAIVNTHDSIFDIGTCVSVMFLRRIEGYASIFQCARDNQSQALIEYDLKGFVL